MIDQMGQAIARQLVGVFRELVGVAEAVEGGSLRYVTGEMHPLANLGLVGVGGGGGVRDVVGPLVSGVFPSAVILTGGDDEASAAELERVGFFRAEAMGLMSVKPEGLRATEVPEGYRFVELGVGDEERFCASFAAGYDVPVVVARMLSPGAGARAGSRMRFYGMERVGDGGGVLAAVSACVVMEGMAGVYMVATRPEHRGKGLAKHLTAEPLRRAWGEGVEVGVLQSSAMGDAVYRKLGFQSHGMIPLYVRLPGAVKG